MILPRNYSEDLICEKIRSKEELRDYKVSPPNMEKTNYWKEVTYYGS